MFEKRPLDQAKDGKYYSFLAPWLALALVVMILAVAGACGSATPPVTPPATPSTTPTTPKRGDETPVVTTFAAAARDATDSGLSLANSARSFASAVDLFLLTDVEGLAPEDGKFAGVVDDLAAGYVDYKRDLNATAEAMARMRSELPATTGGLLPWMPNSALLPRPVYAMGPTDLTAVNDILDAGAAASAQVKQCKDEWKTLPVGSNAWINKFNACKAMIAATQAALVHQGVRAEVSYFGGKVGGAAGAGVVLVYLATGPISVPVTVGSAVVALGLTAMGGVIGDQAGGAVAEWIFDTCTAALSPAGGGALRAPLPGGCTFVHGRGATNQEVLVPLAGTGDLTIFLEGYAPLAIENVELAEGRQVQVSADLVPLGGVTPGAVANAMRNSKVAAKKVWTLSETRIDPPEGVLAQPARVRNDYTVTRDGITHKTSFAPTSFASAQFSWTVTATYTFDEPPPPTAIPGDLINLKVTVTVSKSGNLPTDPKQLEYGLSYTSGSWIENSLQYIDSPGYPPFDLVGARELRIGALESVSTRSAIFSFRVPEVHSQGIAIQAREGNVTVTWIYRAR